MAGLEPMTSGSVVHRSTLSCHTMHEQMTYLFHLEIPHLHWTLVRCQSCHGRWHCQRRHPWQPCVCRIHGYHSLDRWRHLPCCRGSEIEKPSGTEEHVGCIIAAQSCRCQSWSMEYRLRVIVKVHNNERA